MSINRQMDKEAVVYIYNGILLSHNKKDEIMLFVATWMDLEIIILSDVKKRRHILYKLNVESNKNDTK